MKLRAITLNNVRRFTDPVRVAGIEDGLNVLCEPNEHGKSTLFDAIQALFFKPHGSRDKEVSALRPHAGGAPEVSIELETDDGRFTVHKRWLQKPAATVHRGTTLIAQADAAEAWIADTLGGDAGGPSGLIWVRQGVTDLAGGSTRDQRMALDARRDLMTSVGQEVEQMTGGRRMDQALARCREELATYATGTGRPRTNGPWKDAQDRVDGLTALRDGLAATARELHEALDQRQRARRELAEWEDPDAVAARRAKLDAAQKAHEAAATHAEAVDTEARKLALARHAAAAAQDRLLRLREARTEHATATALVAEARRDTERKRADHAARSRARDAADRALQDATDRLTAADTAFRQAQRARSAREGAERRRELAARIGQAEAARSTMETAAAAARAGPDGKALNRIEALAAAHTAALAARDAAATRVIARYAPGRDGAIHAAAGPLPDGQPVPLPGVTRLDIDGIGTLELHPAQTGDGTRIETAAAALRQALVGIGADSLDAARALAAARSEAERQHGEARAVLASLAPDGIDRLREALARIPQLDDTSPAPDPETAEAASNAARADHETARLARETASDLLADARAEAMRAETALTSLSDRLTRAEAALNKAGDSDEGTLASQADAAALALDAAIASHARLVASAPDLAGTEATLARARSVTQRADTEIARLKPLLARLDERISRSAGDAVEERLAETEQDLSAASDALAGIEHEVAVLQRLEQALETARNDARERYFAPIARELKPLLHLLWPEADLTWGEESLLPDALIRDGRHEPVDILSGGTQEQIALLVRLAFARMLAATGRTAPVILDDALVFTDDDRIERMFDALHRQAGDLQILVLTCRQRAFRDLGGNALRLAPPVAANAG